MARYPPTNADTAILRVLVNGFSGRATFPNQDIIDRAIAYLGGYGEAMLQIDPQEMFDAIEYYRERANIPNSEMSNYAPSKVRACLVRWQEFMDPDQDSDDSEEEADDDEEGL